MEEAQRILTTIIENVEQSILGKHDAIELIVACLACGGHVLLEDIPGVGKTRLASALAASVDTDFKRIQFTPDILPSDITGFSVFNPQTGEFTFRPGPVMSHLVLADEINRATPKAQASLLEIMEESQVTVDARTYSMPQPFMVLATQNPIEYAGTYPLPEAQLDRFMIRISLGYPSFEEEVRLLLDGKGQKPVFRAVADTSDILRVRKAVEAVRLDKSIAEYMVAVATQTRNNPWVELGVSPRGVLALLSLSRAFALLRGRLYIIPDDVHTLAPYVFAHRIRLNSAARLEGKNALDIVKDILTQVPAPSLIRKP